LYNGGLIVVRREKGILAAWVDLFSRSVAAGPKPWHGSPHRGSTCDFGLSGNVARTFQAPPSVVVRTEQHRHRHDGGGDYRVGCRHQVGLVPIPSVSPRG
jgi:hypothetical protein